MKKSGVTDHYLILCLLLVITGFPLGALAATNGSLGSISTGSVSISLTIPAHRQVHLAPVENPPRSAHESISQYCIGVTDRSMKSSLRNYSFIISSLSNEPIESLYWSSSSQQQMVELQEPFSVQITNAHSRKLGANDVCALSNGNTLHFDQVKGNSAPLLLELIPE